jgi:4-amino-4-deoxy-L-arabinose transferase-like glycosyltransferase
MKLAVSIFWERVCSWIPFLMGAAVMWVVLGEANRTPTGDAPHLLAIADRLGLMFRRGDILDFFESWTSLVTPHPPAGYLLPTTLGLLGVESAIPRLTGLLGLALSWYGMNLLSRGDHRSRWGPWMGGLLLMSSAMTWTLVEHMAWDVLAAGCVAACVGHLHESDGFRNKGHALAFGAFMGLGFVTKYTFPAFLLVPVLFAGRAMIRFRTVGGLLVSLLGFSLIAGPWLWVHADSVLAYVANSTSAGHSISDSPARTWVQRLSPDNLLYYPTVLRDAIGWPGVLLVGVAFVRVWMRPAGRWAAWSVLGGVVVLSFAGENQARYLFPAIPLLGVIVDIGIRPGFAQPMARFGLLCGLSALLPSAWGVWSIQQSDRVAPPARDQTHAVEGLLSWGEWPWPAPAFRPIENPMKEWRIDEAIAAIAEQTGAGAHQIGILLPRDARLPPAATYPWRAGRRNLEWDVATIAVDGPQGRPMVFVGPLKPLGERIDRRFRVAYAVHTRGAPPILLTNIQGQVVWQHELPGGLQGSVFQVPAQGWNTPTGLLLQKDPLDG